jgi:ADP-ribosyl-[dinitrogen reductase] hydrolase
MTTHPNLRNLLQPVIAAAEAAGRTLAAEFARPDGPRGGADHADVAALRKQLLELLSARWRGEETGVLAGAGGPYCWLVDPHDGTSALPLRYQVSFAARSTMRLVSSGRR